MLADFKIVSIHNADNGSQTIVFRFYEGAVTTENEPNIEGIPVAVTRYRRTGVLNTLRVNRDSQLDYAGVDALGRAELADVAGHDPIEEQRVG